MNEFIPFSQQTPSHYQEIIISDGQYFRSGIWVILEDGKPGHFIPDPNRPIKYVYWMPKPEITHD